MNRLSMLVVGGFLLILLLPGAFFIPFFVGLFFPLLIVLLPLWTLIYGVTSRSRALISKLWYSKHPVR